jgi:hypothetical protein
VIARGEAIQRRNKISDCTGVRQTYGDFKVLDFENQQVFAYLKAYQGTQLLVVLNFSNDQQTFSVDKGVDTSNAKLLIGTMDKGEIKDGKIALEAWEGIAFTL